MLVDTTISHRIVAQNLPYMAAKNLAVVVGAGPTGLVSALMLKQEGWDVVVLEKRNKFSRANMITLKMEIASTLRELGLIEAFEQVAARLDTHYKYYVRGGRLLKREVNDLSGKSVSGLVDFAPESLDSILNNDGKYSISIANLQNFLATHAIARGIQIVFSQDVELRGPTELDSQRVIARNRDDISSEQKFEPNLIVLSDGASGQVGESRSLALNEHPTEGENWIFGTVKYPPEWAPRPDKGGTGVTVLDYDQENQLDLLTIATFNPKANLVNIMVSLKEDHLEKGQIKDKIVVAANRVFQQAQQESHLLRDHQASLAVQPETFSNKVVTIHNRRAEKFYLGGNTILAGDRAAVSSPLPGLGATLGLTCYAYGVRELSRGLTSGSISREEAFRNYDLQANACANKWFKISQIQKQAIQEIKE